MSILNSIYINSPIFLRSFFGSAYGIMWYHRRYGKIFHLELPRVIERESWDYNRFLEYQLKNLKTLIKWAYETVPFYKEKFDKVKIKPDDINKLSDLEKIPFLTREDIRLNGENLISKKISKFKCNSYFTSGSTHSPIKILYGPDMHSHWTAFYEARVRRWAGVNYKMPRSMVGGRIVISKKRTKPPFWIYNFVEKQIYFSAFHISPRNIKYYANCFERYKPSYHSGYAYSTYYIASLLKEEKISIPPLKAILTSSETLYPEMRKIIEEVFGARVYDAYSGVEACCLASECEYQKMHISPDLGIIELVDKNGNPIKENEIGEIVATGFLNYAQPLIRYKTGDLAIFSKEKCHCGRDMPIFKNLIGRLEETIIAPDGSRVCSFLSVFYGIKGVREVQVVQEDLHNISLNVVPDKTYDKKSEKIIVQRVKERLGNVNVLVNLVEKIERTSRGKMKAVISKVKID